MEKYVDYTLFFLLYSFLGWVLEFLHSGIADGKFTGKGFLFSPLSPLYGTGALIILLTSQVINSLFKFAPTTALIITVLLSVIFVSIVEYLTALFYEKVFGKKLWDYSNEAFNLQGRICLKYSLLWGGLAVILLMIVHPLSKHYILQIPFGMRRAAALVLSIYLVTDTCVSVKKRI